MKQEEPCVPKSGLEILEDFYKYSISEKDPNRKGSLFEAFVLELFKTLPCEVELSNLKRKKGGDIDLLLMLKSDPRKCGLPFIEENVVMIEAKNWKKPIGENVVDSFINKMRKRGIKTGIIITSGNITDVAFDAATRVLNEGYVVLLIDHELINEVFKGSRLDEVLSKSYKKLLSFI